MECSSYRSIIKDDHRTWDVEVEESAMYSIEMLYKMKYDFKEFTLETPEQTLNFLPFPGRLPKKEIVEELFDGNETHHEQNISKTAYGKANIGTIQLKKRQTDYCAKIRAKF